MNDERINALADIAYERWRALPERMDARAAFAQAISEALRWIPVTERLPTAADGDDNGDVLWYSPTGWTVTGAWQCGDKQPFGASHWMPLPPPPETEK